MRPLGAILKTLGKWPNASRQATVVGNQGKPSMEVAIHTEGLSTIEVCPEDWVRQLCCGMELPDAKPRAIPKGYLP